MPAGFCVSYSHISIDSDLLRLHEVCFRGGKDNKAQHELADTTDALRAACSEHSKNVTLSRSWVFDFLKGSLGGLSLFRLRISNPFGSYEGVCV